MKAAVLFSGGKDSCLALHLAKQEGYEIKYLLSVLPKDFDSFMFHKPYFNLIEKQSEMLGIELVFIESEGKENEELKDLREIFSSVKDKVDCIVVGGVASNYQGDRIKKICNEFDLKFYAPLWGISSEKLWKLLLEDSFKVILTKISCEGLSKDFLGKVIDKKMLDEIKKLSLKYKFRADFEGGEAESAVLFMPDYKGEIKIKYKTRNEGEYRHYLDITKVY